MRVVAGAERPAAQGLPAAAQGQILDKYLSSPRVGSGGNVLGLLINARATADIGVDLGTSSTLVHVRGRGVVVNEPSVVAVRRDSGSICAIGLNAKRMLGRTTEQVLPVRPVRGGVIANVDLAEAMLRSFLKQAVRGPFPVPALRPRVVVGVPTGITELERRAVRSSAVAAGARKVYLVPEPLAAAIGAGLPVDSPRGSMVVDIGAGSTEVAVISMGGIVCETSIRVAGDDLDAAIVAHVRKHHNLLIGEPTAEAAKIQLASVDPDAEPSTISISGRDLVSGLPRRIELDNAEVRDAIQEPVRQIIAAVVRALEATPPELAADIAEYGLVMTGGGSSIRGLDRLIERYSHVPVRVDPDPLTCVVRGTAAILENMDRYRSMLHS